MDKENVKLNDLIAGNDQQAIQNEIKHLVSQVTAEFDFDILKQTHTDLTRLFNGEFPGYQASNTKYHDQEHTCLVTLAATRLVHGLFLEGRKFAARDILLGLLAAFFHDAGLIQTEDDTEGSGAKYTIGHEARSIAFMSNYLSGKGFSEEDTLDCGHMIMCTILKLSPGEIPFRSEQTEIMGKILGTADLLAQMADRYYLEKLPLLFTELREGGIHDYTSELELLKKTNDFYQSVARARLTRDLGNIAPAMKAHFRARWDLDRDLYTEAISSNIEYLSEIHNKCRNIYDCYVQYLRRGDIMKRFFEKTPS